MQKDTRKQGSLSNQIKTSAYQKRSSASFALSKEQFISCHFIYSAGVKHK